MLCPIYQNAEAENRQKPLFVTLQTTYLRCDKPKRRYGKTERRFIFHTENLFDFEAFTVINE